MPTRELIQTRELLVPGALGDEVVILRSGIGLGELSLLGIGKTPCSLVAQLLTFYLNTETLFSRLVKLRARLRCAC